MKYKLIASDCDGTLINSNSEMSERTFAAIRKCLDRGIIFVLATGRPPYGVQWFADRFDEDLPLVTYNGASVSMSKSGKIICTQTLPGELCAEVIRLGTELGTGVFLYLNNKLHVANSNAHTDSYARFFNINPIVADDIYERVKDGATKVLWTDSEEKISKYYAEMEARFSGRLNCHTSASTLLEFVGPYTSKGLALKEIGALYGISADEMVAFGDGFNDVSMLEYAGLGIAVANAPEGVKDIAGRVALSNDEDGVAAMIEELLAE